MSAEDSADFVRRWSRRKVEARKPEEKPAEPKSEAAAQAAPAATAAAAPAQPVPLKAAAPSGAGVQSAVAATQLPPLESLKGLASEYTEFLKPGVDEDLRRAALKKLFRDPHFENFERFEAYCEDYTKGAPIPLAMLKTLQHAKRLLFDDEKKEEQGKKDEQDAAAKGGAKALPESQKASEEQVEAKTQAPAVPAEPQKET